MAEEIIIRDDIELGAWEGIGGAITEATAFNFSKLDSKKQQELLDAYYGKNGLNYHWARVSIGSNDFCLKPYEYSQKKDLSDFSIQHDKRYVLPMLKKIVEEKDLKILASPWSPPKCLKLARKNRLSGKLKFWRYKTYARYIRKWLEAYAEEGIDIDYITPQNEPFAKQIWESCTYSYLAQKRLAYKYLARQLDGLKTQILLWDHNKGRLAETANRLFNGKYATEYGREKKVAGLCYHWYDGIFPDQMWQVRQKYPGIVMLSSEMSCGFSPYNKLKWQKDASLYCRELFADINAGANAFIDWNMLLSWQGGPSHCKNYVKSPIILNEKEDDFVLTPIYEALKNFAHLFPVESEVVRCEYDSNNIVAIARKAKRGYKVVVMNTSDQEQEVVIKLGKQKKNLRLARFEIVGVAI
ncbi:hypothetical protein IKD82_03005 [Candidatus Saccharibacteria bacterium]|nr:hypothetical protein [Candidatus Saccharibacteria bacterium]